jgi:arylsulfatase A-like enzyme
VNRRDFLRSTAAAAITLTLGCKTTAASPSDKPNIVYIMLDEWGYFEWSAMGHPILQTPNIDKMASEGIRFTQFLAGGSVCAPTRSTLMTGQHTGHTTVRSNGGGNALRSDDVTIADILKAAGYTVGGFGKWGLGDAGTTGVPEKHGFDTFFGYYHQVHAHSYYPRYLLRNSEKVMLEGNTGDFYTGEVFSHDLIHREALEFIRASASTGAARARPFFAYLPYTPPHGHWGMPADDPAWQKYKDKKWDSSNQKGTHDAQTYAAMVEMIDRQIGEILELLRELGIEKNTIVFVCGDNGGQPYFRNEKHPHGFLAPNLNPRTGERFRGGKGSFYEGGLRIPFIVRWPGRIKPGSVSDHLGYFPDVMPTLAELAGTEPREDTDGISFVPALLGENETGRKQEKHDYLYWEDGKSCAVRMGNWKAVKPNKARPFELYDLSKDLEELDDVADEHPDILEKMMIHAKNAHTPHLKGRVLDASKGFKGHRK